MNKIEVIQKIIEKKNAKTYLEIGVASGDCFFNIKASRKIAVDIEFSFPRRWRIKKYFENPSNIFNRYYKMSSDEFFTTHSGFGVNQRF